MYLVRQHKLDTNMRLRGHVKEHYSHKFTGKTDVAYDMSRVRIDIVVLPPTMVSKMAAYTIAQPRRRSSKSRVVAGRRRLFKVVEGRRRWSRVVEGRRRWSRIALTRHFTAATTAGTTATTERLRLRLHLSRCVGCCTVVCGVRSASQQQTRTSTTQSMNRNK